MGEVMLEFRLAKGVKRFLFHVLGFASLFGGLFIESIMLYDIMSQGFFFAIEPNPLILQLEIALLCYAWIYFTHCYIHMIKRFTRGKPRK